MRSDTRKWKWHDMWPSMVAHTLNLCSAFNPSEVHTHSSEHTHTPWTHNRSSGQPFMLRRPGSSWGIGALLKGTSVVVLRAERALYIHSPHLQFTYKRSTGCHSKDLMTVLWLANIKIFLDILYTVCEGMILCLYSWVWFPGHRHKM